VVSAAAEDADVLAWWRAASEPAIDRLIRAMHESAEETVRAKRPICLASGRCCAFREHGHRLYVTGLEAAWTWMDLVRRSDRLPSAGSRRVALDDMRCPLLRDGLCGAHASRPSGCRVYFCDRAAQSWQPELMERLHGEVRALHEAHGIPYEYSEWIGLLGRIGDAWDKGVLSMVPSP
jgi:Fe-S-cluster containining protein